MKKIKKEKIKKEALYYSVKDTNTIVCGLCPHCCTVKEQASGLCGVRVNRNNIFYTDIYGEVTSAAVDPIEKKPLYHYYPSSQIFSIGTKGCNFSCSYCQNYRISQDISVQSEYYSPEKITAAALQSGAMGIAYTYSEPVIWIEFVIDCARVASAQGLKNVLVTNGHVCPAPLDDLLACIDAMNIDLKTFNAETCRRVNGGNLEAVKKTIERAALSKCHIELTTLIVTGVNDSFEEMEHIINYIASINREIPWHISRYHPAYQYIEPATDIAFMLEVYTMAKKKLDYVYTGNIPAQYNASNTLCPQCGSLLIERSGFLTKINALSQDLCEKCGRQIPVIV